jgi:hypothetical protein
MDREIATSKRECAWEKLRAMALNTETRHPMTDAERALVLRAMGHALALVEDDADDGGDMPPRPPGLVAEGGQP